MFPWTTVRSAVVDKLSMILTPLSNIAHNKGLLFLEGLLIRFSPVLIDLVDVLNLSDIPKPNCSYIPRNADPAL